MPCFQALFFNQNLPQMHQALLGRPSCSYSHRTSPWKKCLTPYKPFSIKSCPAYLLSVLCVLLSWNWLIFFGSLKLFPLLSPPHPTSFCPFYNTKFCPPIFQPWDNTVVDSEHSYRQLNKVLLSKLLRWHHSYLPKSSLTWKEMISLFSLSLKPHINIDTCTCCWDFLQI